MKQERNQDRSEFETEKIPVSSNESRRWDSTETLSYLVFLDFHRSAFLSKKRCREAISHQKREEKLFEKMALFIKTRTPLQCWSHHHKLVSKYKDFRKVIQTLSQNISKENFIARKLELKATQKVEAPPIIEHEPIQSMQPLQYFVSAPIWVPYYVYMS